ncbi:MAG TPA: carbonic anhydrase [Mycobacterium sp.]|nr:carbonic anhydrase [Mycobacterium sp.]HQC76719.1 carbonic anhydrase [Mycobacterium sp.]
MFTPNRRHFLGGAALAGLGAVAGCSRNKVIHGEHTLTEDTANLTPDQALAKLTEGNARFVGMTEIEPNVSSARLVAVASGQKPFVGVLGCVDSRVPPELVFDRGLGDIFDARIAGAIPDDAAIGSLEFGVEEFGVPLLVVLGHSRCGAVTAAVKEITSGGPPPPGRIGAVVDPILPAVKAVQAQGVTGDAVINASAKEVVRRSVAALHDSPVLRDRLADGKLKIVGAFYDLDTGKVEFLP